jgi:hypothetical protein
MGTNKPNKRVLPRTKSRRRTRNDGVGIALLFTRVAAAINEQCVRLCVCVCMCVRVYVNESKGLSVNAMQSGIVIELRTIQQISQKQQEKTNKNEKKKKTQ